MKKVRRGLSLIEIMIALTMTLIVLGAMMTAFQFASEKMQSGRAIMELANRARTAESLLRSDLEGLTLDPRPYAQTTTPPGYFEYQEGPRRDDWNASLGDIDSYLGDVDDILGMTVRSKQRSFRGRYNGAIEESPLAEVVWFTTFNDRNGNNAASFDESVRLHRRVLLIRPALTASGLLTGQLLNDANATTVNAYLADNDISCRVVVDGTAYDVFANNLTDLGDRKNRFCHSIAAFPNLINRTFLDDPVSTSRRDRSGGDIILTDVAGFDLKVYSPNSQVNSVSDMIVEPGDPGFVSTGTPPTLGSFVDLGYGHDANGTTNLSNTSFFDPNGWFSAAASFKSQCNFPVANICRERTNVYDTWTPAYESDGINQDGDALTDEGTDGLDNDGANGVDDTGERETLPPYAHPVRGLKISIRLIEKGTKQVHQTSIVHSFVPE